MPIYEYRCEECKKPFEVFVRTMSAAVNAVCPNCGSEHAEKQVTAATALGMSASAVFDSAAASCAPSG